MRRTIKRVMLSTVSVLAITCLFWTLFILNPSWSYANKTQFDAVTVYHNQDLDEQTENVIINAVDRIRKSALFTDELAIDLCLNDDHVYPYLHPLAGQPLAYALMNKTVVKNCKVSFDDNLAVGEWEVNNFEHREFNLTWLLAHEFSHNLQYHSRGNYVLKSTLGKINWKLEGHAEYIARGFINDGELRHKIEQFQSEEEKEHNGIPVFELEDGTQQIMSYYKYALVIQYLMEERSLDFSQICELDTELDQLYSEMIAWSKP